MLGGDTNVFNVYGESLTTLLNESTTTTDVNALKAFTIVEWVADEGKLLSDPQYDAEDTFLEGVEVLNIDSSEAARAILEKKENV